MAFWLELFSWFSSNYGIFQQSFFQLLFSVDQKEEENKKTTLSERAAEKNKPNSQVQNVFFLLFIQLILNQVSVFANVGILCSVHLATKYSKD